MKTLCYISLTFFIFHIIHLLMNSTLAERISDINQTVVSPHMVSLPIGRGYYLGDEYTDDAVHVSAIVPSLINQRRLIHEFADAVGHRPRPDLYVGVGGMMNLSYISAIRPKAAILIDVNPLQTMFWQQVFNDIADNKKPRGFKKAARKTEAKLKETLTERFESSGLEHTQNIESFINGTRLIRLSEGFEGFVSTALVDRFWLLPENYVLLRQLAGEGNLASLTLDIADEPACQQFAHVLDSFDLGADFFHVSNVLNFMNSKYDWVGREGNSGLLEQAIRNIELISGSDSTKIITDDECVLLSEIQRLGHSAMGPV